MNAIQEQECAMSHMERIFFIDREIRNNGKVTVNHVADEYEVSTRQVKRDIEYMRERLNAPLEWSHEKSGYVYAKAFEPLQFADEKALLFYTFIEKISESRQYLPFISEEILKQIRRFIGRDYQPLIGRISYETGEFEEFDLTVFRTIMRAFLEKKVVKFDYQDRGGKQTRRTVEPLHLIHYDDRWYCVAWDHSRRDIRKFHFARIENAKVTDSSCSAHVPKKQLEEYVDGSFGIFKGRKTTRAVFRFWEPVYYGARRQVWHPAQHRKEGEDPARGKYVEWSVPVSDYTELIGKILRYGEAAEAVSPPDFRKAWLSSIRALYGRYCGDGEH
jgi:predicted DNA-binding transcriptional regulator YafY